MQRRVSIRTPENIEFSYRLAGLGSRAFAVTIDMVLLALAVGIVSTGASLVAGLAGLGLGTFVASATMAVGIAVMFTLVFAYFVMFEALWNGQTPGKRILGIRVVKDRGHGIRFVDSLLRNLLRIADMVPALYLVGGTAALLSSRNKRLGDLAAGTLVVVVEKALPGATATTTPSRFNSLREDPLLAARIRTQVSTREVELARDLLSRPVGGAVRDEAAALLAATLRDRLALGDWKFLSDEALLRDLVEVLEYGDETAGAPEPATS